MDDLYGGTYRMFTKIYNNSGIKFHYVDMNNLENVQSLMKTLNGLGRNTYKSINEVCGYCCVAKNH
jgi:cystathionine beta-lyase/cystathionine gamma-synthase